MGAEARVSQYYRPRSPASTVLYRTVQENWLGFQDLVAREERRLPRHVIKEFEGFLRCGIHAHGFLRLQCKGCRAEKFLAFSCKKRGFCPSCGGRRMNETAAHLVDRVFPKVGVRQWVVSFPMPVRFILARDPKLQSEVLAIVLRVIRGWMRERTGRRKLETGAVTVLQRFGGSLNLNLHFHILLLEGGYEDGSFHWIPELGAEDVGRVLEKITYRTIRALKKKGHFADGKEALAEEDFGEDVLPGLQAASVRNRVALGERSGQWVRRVGSLGVGERVEMTGRLQAAKGGFSLDAGVYCGPNERKKLEQLCRYVARPAVAEERLRRLPNENVLMKLKRSYSDGTSHLVFGPMEMMEKLAALVPPPRAHLTRYHGVLGPHARIRSRIVPQVVEETEACCGGNVSESVKRRRMGWAKLMARVFEVDVGACERCGEEMRVVAAILEKSVIERILRHVGMPHTAPPLRLRVNTQEGFLFPE